MKIFDNFYAYLWPGLTAADMRTYGNNCNTYLFANVTSEGKHVIVDPGKVVNEINNNCFDRLVIEIEEDGIKVEDIGLIVATHAHPDHYWACEEIKKRSGAPIATGEQEWEYFQANLNKISAAFKLTMPKLPEFNPDIFLKEGKLNLSEELVAEFILTPGHSVGHLGIYFPATKIFIGGDLVFYHTTGRIDLPGGNAQVLRNSVDKVAQMDIEYLLAGHQYFGPGIIKGKEAIKSNFEYIIRNNYPSL